MKQKKIDLNEGILRNLGFLNLDSFERNRLCSARALELGLAELVLSFEVAFKLAWEGAFKLAFKPALVELVLPLALASPFALALAMQIHLRN